MAFVIGGTRGFPPYAQNAICGFLRFAGAQRLHVASIGRAQKHAPQIADYLRAMNDVYDLRNACALTFYSTGVTLGGGYISFYHLCGRSFLQLFRSSGLLAGGAIVDRLTAPLPGYASYSYSFFHEQPVEGRSTPHADESDDL